MKKLLHFVCVLLVAVTSLGLSLGFAACGESADENVLTVGMECGYAPFNYTQLDDSNGAVKIDNAQGYANGYDVMIAKKIAESLGKKLVIKKYEFKGLIPAVQAGTLDLIIAGMSPTAERKESIAFSDAYYQSQLVIVVKKDGKYKGRLTKKEEKKDFKYYFNEQNKVIMTERYSEGELLNIIFYFYNHDNIEIVFYSLREMSIAIIGEINYVDGKITDLFLTNNLSLFNEYGFNHFAYNKLLFTYNNNEVLMKRTRSFVDSIDIVYNDKTKFFFENKQKDIIPGTDKVIVTSSRETLI